jgi:flagellin
MSSFSQINTNIQSMQAFSSLQDTTSELASRRQRLSTGKRINAAEDDSAGFAIAKKLEAKTRGQSQALKNVNDAKSMLTVAEGGLNSSLDILQTMKEKAVQAANDTLGANERDAIQSQLQELSKEVGDIVGSTSFNGTNLLDKSGGENSDGKLSFQVGAENGDSFDVQLASAKTDDLGITGDSFGGSLDTGDTDVDAEGLSADPVVDASSFSGDPQEFTASVTAVNASDIQVDVTDADGNTVASGKTIDFSSGNTLDLSSEIGVSVDLSGTDQNSFATSEAFSFEIEDTTLDVGSSSNANTTISKIDSAIGEVTDQLAGIGDAQKRLSFKGDNLETSRTNLESARSGIEDADFAREQMQIAKLQILQQTGTATLAQANASSQGVLSLVG